MFKSFSGENSSSNSQVKSSVARGVRQRLQEQYPSLEGLLEAHFNKKKAMYIVKT